MYYATNKTISSFSRHPNTPVPIEELRIRSCVFLYCYFNSTNPILVKSHTLNVPYQLREVIGYVILFTRIFEDIKQTRAIRTVQLLVKVMLANNSCFLPKVLDPEGGQQSPRVLLHCLPGRGKEDSVDVIVWLPWREYGVSVYEFVQLGITSSSDWSWKI